MKQTTKNLEQAFLKRGYQKNHLSNQFQKASSKERSDLLLYKDKPEQERNQLLFITTYNKTLPRIRNALNKHWNLLQINEELKGSFEQTPKLVYRRNKNIRDYICLLYTSPSPRDKRQSRMPSSA